MKLNVRVVIKITLLTLMWSTMCYSQKVDLNAKTGTVKVKGKIGNVNPPMQLWVYVGDEKWDTIPVKNGKFNYKKETKLPAYGAMMLRYTPYKKGGASSFFSNMSLMSLYFEEGKIKVSSKEDSLGKKHATVSGSKTHDVYMEFWNKEDDIVKTQRAIAAEFNKATPEQIQSQDFLNTYELKNKKLLEDWDDLMVKTIKNHPNSLVSYLSFLGYLRAREPETSLAFKIANMFEEGYRNKAVNSIENMITKEKKQNVAINIGDNFPTFDLYNPSGKLVGLKSFMGKYILVDLWASWCVPCRKVNPQLVKLYNKYSNQSFEIIGISFDTNKEKWQEAIKTDQLPWVHVSDLKGTNGEVGIKYGVNYIPQNYLLDPNGKVIGKNLKIETIEDMLKPHIDLK